jgi:hypothetical protein
MEHVQILQEERIQTETPEADLWRAVIEQAIEDLSDPDLNESTVQWFTSASDHPASFRWICVLLDLDASAVWAALKQRGSRKDPPSACASAPNKRRKPNEHRSRLDSMYSRRTIGLSSRFRPSPR